MVWVLPGGYAYHIDKMCGMIGRRNRLDLVELHESRLEDYDYSPCWRCAREVKPAAPIQEQVTKLDEVGPDEYDDYFNKTRRKGYFNEDMQFIEDDEVWVKENGMRGVIDHAFGYKKSVRGSDVEHHYRVKFWPESDPSDVRTRTYPESQLERRGKSARHN